MIYRRPSVRTAGLGLAPVFRALTKLMTGLFKFMLCMIFLAGCAGATLVSTWAFVELPSHAAPPVKPIEIPEGMLARMQAGDLVFRIGNDWTSDIVRDAQNGEKDPYSHVGILTGNKSHWQVLHAVPAELPDRVSAVVLDDLEFFLSPERAQGVAVYRVKAEASVRRTAIENAMARLGEPFRIVENDSEGHYCTTLLWHAWKNAGVDLTVNFDHLNIPLQSGQYLLPYSLRAAPELSLVFEVRARQLAGLASENDGH